jgi:hypothetical protein
MKKYKEVDVDENKLEDLVRIGSELIEPGLKYVDHQRTTDKGRIDVILVDSGNSLVLAELKIIEDDNMLVQALDYYDYISNNIEAHARIYKEYKIDPTKPIRIFLLAPSFSQTLINRSKWIDAPISLFTFKCISLEGSEDITPVFYEILVPTPQEIIQEKYTIEDKISYIASEKIKTILKEFLHDVKNWDKERILVEPIKYSISVKIAGNVFMYITPRKDKFLIETNNSEGKLTPYPINSKEDITNIIEQIKINMAKKIK